MKMTLDWLTNPPEMDDDDEEEPKRFYGVATGKVTSLLDPMGLGRVQLELPFLDSSDDSPWARIAVPMSGVMSGAALLPQVGDEVLVAFEHGDTNVPYVIGSLWNGFAPPPPNVPVPDSPVRTSYTIRTAAGNQVLITEEPPAIQILSPAAGQTISMTKAGTVVLSTTAAKIVVGDSVISVDVTGVKISGTSITLAGTASLNLKAPNINIAATGECHITGGMVIINP